MPTTIIINKLILSKYCSDHLKYIFILLSFHLYYLGFSNQLHDIIRGKEYCPYFTDKETDGKISDMKLLEDGKLNI